MHPGEFLECVFFENREFSLFASGRSTRQFLPTSFWTGCTVLEYVVSFIEWRSQCQKQNTPTVSNLTVSISTSLRLMRVLCELQFGSGTGATCGRGRSQSNAGAGLTSLHDTVLHGILQYLLKGDSNAVRYQHFNQ